MDRLSLLKTKFIKWAFLAVWCVSLPACNSEKDDPKPQGPNLVGTWDIVRTEYEEYDLNWTFVRDYTRTNTDPNDPIRIYSELLANGTWREYQKNSLRYNGSYSRNGNKLIFEHNGNYDERNLVSLTEQEFVLKDTTTLSNYIDVTTVIFRRR